MLVLFGDPELLPVEVLAKVPIDQLDDAMRALKGCRSAEELRVALVERIATAPLSDFQALKAIYLAHCAG
jgi:hypothetical protein